MFQGLFEVFSGVQRVRRFFRILLRRDPSLLAQLPHPAPSRKHLPFPACPLQRRRGCAHTVVACGTAEWHLYQWPKWFSTLIYSSMLVLRCSATGRRTSKHRVCKITAATLASCAGGRPTRRISTSTRRRSRSTSASWGTSPGPCGPQRGPGGAPGGSWPTAAYGCRAGA